MKKTLWTLLLMSVAAFAQAVESPKWDSLSVAYLSMDLENDDVSLDGLGVSGTKTLGDQFFVSAAYATLSDEVDINGISVDTDYTPLSVGLGIRHSAAPNIDIFGLVSYEDAELEASAGGYSTSVSDDGYGISAGVRAMVIPSLELSGSLNYVSMEESETGFGVSARFYLNDQFALGAGYDETDGVNGTSLMATLFF